MISWNMHTGIRQISDQFKDLFLGRSASFPNLAALFTYFLFGKSSLSSLVRCAPWTHSVSDLSRAINAVDGPRWLRRMRKRILNKYSGQLNMDDFCLAIDDTNNPKFGGSFRAGNWYGSKGHYHGHRIVVVALVDFQRKIAIPLSYEIAAKQGQPNHKPAPEIAIALLAAIKKEGFPVCLPVVCDSWFDGVHFVKQVKDLGFELVWEMKSNRKVKCNPGPFVRKKGLHKAFEGEQRIRLHQRFESKAILKRQRKRRCGSQKRLILNGYQKFVNCVAVFNRRNGAKAFAFWSSTNLELPAEKIWELSRGRWKIECLFRDLKQHLSFGRLPVGSEDGANISICIPFILYTSLRQDPEKWGCQVGQSIGAMVGFVREESLENAIENLVMFPVSKRSRLLYSRRRKDRSCKKPVNQSAETIPWLKPLRGNDLRATG